jgi:hypothetical protein
MAARVPRIGIVGPSNVYLLTYVERRGLCRTKVKLIGSPGRRILTACDFCRLGTLNRGQKCLAKVLLIQFAA